MRSPYSRSNRSDLFFELLLIFLILLYAVFDQSVPKTRHDQARINRKPYTCL